MDGAENPWDLYDTLIAGIPEDRVIDRVIPGGRWTMVRSGSGTGLAMTIAPRLIRETRPRTLPPSLEGYPLRKLAEASKSWNFVEAALGVAAINAFWNSPEHPAVAGTLKNEDKSAFAAWRERAAGKKAAVIGHFPDLEKSIGMVCELSILEKRPQGGDYPDSACEFLLPQQDLVFATGVTLINKTLPRLLGLSNSAEFILVGPSVPLCPRLFDFGARDLQGFVVTNPELCGEIILGNRQDLCIFDAGKRVSIYKLVPDTMI
jgi:uncharacterized protein (DUF4213/DUF364 family)